jgi:hypothetical protein
MHNTNLNLLSKSVDFSHWETVPAEYINNPLIIDPEKTSDLSQVTDKVYHIMLYRGTPRPSGIRTLVVISTDCIGSCKVPCDHDQYPSVNAEGPFEFNTLEVRKPDDVQLPRNYGAKGSIFIAIHFNNTM